MANNVTDGAELLILDWINGVGTPTRPTTPLKVALVTANGSDSAAGTEVVAGGNTYARQSVTFTSAATGSASNTAALTWSNMPGVTVVGVEIWDSAGTPVRLWYGPLTSSQAVTAGNTFQIAAGALTVALD